MNRSMLLIESVRLGARLLDLFERTTRRRIRRAFALAFGGGAGLGAALMYLLDPDRGRRRRKLLGDQIMHVVSQSDALINTTARDLRNRARGMLAETRARFDDTDVIDEVLAARVRSRMGWVISHPHAIAVSADQGRVTLSGPILAHEVDDLLKAVAAVRGVRAVEHTLEVHEQADGVPGQTPWGAARELGAGTPPAAQYNGRWAGDLRRPTGRRAWWAAGGTGPGIAGARCHEYRVGTVAWPGCWSPRGRCPEDHHNRCAGRGGLPLLSQCRQFPALYGASARGARPGQRSFALGRRRASRRTRGVGCRDYPLRDEQGASLAAR